MANVYFQEGYGPMPVPQAARPVDPYMLEIFSGVPAYQLDGFNEQRRDFGSFRGHGMNGPSIRYGDDPSTPPELVSEVPHHDVEATLEWRGVGKAILIGVGVTVAVRILDKMFFKKKG